MLPGQAGPASQNRLPPTVASLRRGITTVRRTRGRRGRRGRRLGLALVRGRAVVLILFLLHNLRVQARLLVSPRVPKHRVLELDQVSSEVYSIDKLRAYRVFFLESAPLSSSDSDHDTADLPGKRDPPDTLVDRSSMSSSFFLVSETILTRLYSSASSNTWLVRSSPAN